MCRCFRKRILSGMLVFSMLISLLPANVFAASEYKPYGAIPKERTVNGQKYYDIYDGAISINRKDTSNPIELFTDVLMERDLLANWSGLAYEIFRDLPVKYTQTDTAKTFDDAFCGNSSSQFDLIDALINKNDRTKAKYRGDRNYYMSTGLFTADSLKEVHAKAGELLKKTTQSELSAKEFASGNPIDTLNNDTKQTVLYTMAAGVDGHTILTDAKEYYLFGLAFYDFKLMPVIDDKPYYTAYDSPSGSMTLEEAIKLQDTFPDFSYVIKEFPKTIKSGVANDTKLKGVYEQKLEDRATVEVSNTITNSSAYTFTDKASATVNLVKKLAPIPAKGRTGTTAFTAQQAIETAYTNQKTLTETNNTGHLAYLPLEPYTTADVISESGEVVMITGYDCPVAITYKVKIFLMRGTVSMHKVGSKYVPYLPDRQTTFYQVFGSYRDGDDAINSLYSQALSEDPYPNETRLNEYYNAKLKKTLLTDLNWASIKSKNSPKSTKWNKLGDSAAIATNLSSARPMIMTGASMTQTMNYVFESPGALKPLYPLDRVETASMGLRYVLNVGDTVPVDAIKLIGLNEKNAEFYGFDDSHGTWSVVDPDRQPLSEEIATLTTDPSSGRVTLEAAGSGRGYITYTVEDDYYYYNGSEKPISSLEVTAPYIVFTITEPPKETFNGTVKATGEITLTVGNDPVYIGDIETVDVAVYDKTGKEIDADVTWEAMELPSRGIIVDNDNMLRVTKAGTFHVRAAYQYAYSDWIDVTAEPSPVAVEEAELTRGDIVMLLHKLIGGEGITGNTGFKDVDINDFGTGKFYEQAVAWALQNGIAVGYSDDYFGVADAITKEQLIGILYNFAQYLGIDTDTEIAQAIQDKIEASGVSIWAKKAVAWALSRGLIAEADLERIKETIVIDEAVDFIAPVLEEGGLPVDGKTPEYDDKIPEESEDSDLSPENGASSDNGDSSDNGTSSAEDGDAGGAAKSGAE